VALLLAVPLAWWEFRRSNMKTSTTREANLLQWPKRYQRSLYASRCDSNTLTSSEYCSESGCKILIGSTEVSDGNLGASLYTTKTNSNRTREVALQEICERFTLSLSRYPPNDQYQR
jgi:hypothetical protein